MNDKVQCSLASPYFKVVARSSNFLEAKFKLLRVVGNSQCLMLPYLQRTLSFVGLPYSELSLVSATTSRVNQIGHYIEQ